MRTHSVWLRLVIVSALRALYTPGGLRTLFMLDEFAQLGHLAPIEDAFGLVRGYGVQLWPVLQDLNQLKALYKDRWETFVGNAGVVQGFAPERSDDGGMDEPPRGRHDRRRRRATTRATRNRAPVKAR